MPGICFAGHIPISSLVYCELFLYKKGGGGCGSQSGINAALYVQGAYDIPRMGNRNLSGASSG